MHTQDNKLTVEHLTSLCQQAFGTNLLPLLFNEIEGGTFNETYLVEFENIRKVILRIAPAQTDDFYWDDQELMQGVERAQKE